ncbi:hypothetical protein N9D31_00865 [Oligoflexaceae bacterium]|nr:hypothetical protein [Oligoflexaceae bacterium]
MNIRQEFVDSLPSQMPAVQKTPESRHKKYLKAGHRHYQGKVRDLYANDEHLIVFHSDRLTAFDRSICNIPYKGSMLAAFTWYWMNHLKNIVPTQSVEVIDCRTLQVDCCQPIKIEVVVRGYLAGSMLRSYKAGERVFHGKTLPDDLKDFSALPEVMITPTSKADVFEHDVDISEDDILAQKLCTESQWLKIKEYAFSIFSEGQKKYAEAGWILADTKYEFGLRGSDVVLIDECHSPDSSRLWRRSQSTYPEMFDKEIVRRYLINQNFSGTGTPPPVPDQLIQELGLAYYDVGASLMQDKFDEFLSLECVN